MGVHEDRIARIVLEAFNKLPAKSKPAVRANGRQDWVPLSGIVICSGMHDLLYEDMKKFTLSKP